MSVTTAEKITPIYVGRNLHAKLKARAANERKSLRDLCEARLWPLVKNGKEKGGGAR